MAQRISKNDTAKRSLSQRNKLVGAGAVILILIAALFLIRFIREQSIQAQVTVHAPMYSSPKGQWILEQKQKAAGGQAGQAAPADQTQNPVAPNAR